MSELVQSDPSARRSVNVRWSAAVLVAVVALGLVGVGPPGADAQPPAPRPMVFVHGFAGSGNQFESQALRFTSNGYPADWIRVHEYDTTFGIETREDVWARLDSLVAEIQVSTGASQIDLLGHSLGTSVMQGYLNSSPERAANVAHYVNLDGSPAGAQPGDVATLAIWAMGNADRTVVGAENITFADQSHTQVVTSAETFAEIYRFFVGRPPLTTSIVKEAPDAIRVSGRVNAFLTNAGTSDATLRVYEVDGATGHRVDETPEATFALTGDASWGPFAADGNSHYEFELRRGDLGHHFYFEPFVRSNTWMRLLSSDPETGIDALWQKSERHSNVVVLRNKEWWGDQGAANDLLEFDGTNIVNPSTSPVSKLAIAFLTFDAGVDGVSAPETAVPALAGLPFISGVDVFMPATTPPDSTITVAATPRLGGGVVQTVNIPNWAGITDRVTVQFTDFIGTVDALPTEPAPASTTTTTAPMSLPGGGPAPRAVAVTPRFAG